jgi:uncharacterized protein with HEPN domain
VPSSDPVQRFTDIVESIDHIERFTSGLNAKTFISDEQVIFAVKYALMIISESAIRRGDAASTLRPDIPWREIRGLGNRLRHEYDTIDLARIWLMVERDLPPLKVACLGALQDLSQGRPPG